MGFNDDRGRNQAAAADNRARRELREAVRTVLATDPGRRVVWDFLQAVGIDGSSFNTNAMAQSHATGMQDAGRWWLNLIRDACPEREAQMRADSIRAAKERRNNREANEDDHD